MLQKKQQASEAVLIDNQLLLVLFGLQAALGLSVSLAEVRRVFADVAAGQTSGNDYRFLQSGRISLTGHIEGERPDSIILHLHHRDASILLPRTISEAGYWARLVQPEA